MSKYLNKKHSVNSLFLFITLFCASLIFLLLLIFLFKVKNPDSQGLIFLALLSGFIILVIAVITILKRRQSESGYLSSETTNNREIQTQDVIKDLQNEKKYFASVLSHDLRSPLSSIVLLASYLKSKEEDPGTLQYIELIEQSARKELDLMATLLTLFRLESFKSDQAEELSLHASITEILQSAESQLNKTDVKAAIDVAPDFSVFANPQGFTLILKCLIGQAICHSDKGETVGITARQDIKSVIIEVIILSEELRKNAGADLFGSNRLALHNTGDPFPVCIPLYFLKKAIAHYNGTIHVQRDGNKPTNRFILTLDQLRAPYTS